MRALRLALAVAGLALAVPSHAQSPSPQWTLPSGGLLHGSKAVIESGRCCEGGRPPTNVKNTDTTALATIPGLASRDGRILRVKLAENRYLKLTDCDHEGGCELDDAHVHRLVSWWPKHRYYVVNVGLYEGGVAYLISERDGRTLMLSAPPVLSPSGRLAIALDSSLMSGIRLEIVDLSRNPPTLAEVTTMPNCAGAGPNPWLRPDPVWIDDSQVKFEGMSPMPGSNPNTKQLLRIIDGNARWQC